MALPAVQRASDLRNLGRNLLSTVPFRRLRGSPAALRALFVAGVLIPCAPRAHPFGDRYAAHGLDVRLEPDGVEVTLAVDVPAVRVPDGGAFLDELAGAVVVSVDGHSVPFTVSTRAARPDLVSGGHTVVYAVDGRAEVDLRGIHEVDVSQGALPAEPAYHRLDVWVPVGAEVRRVPRGPRDTTDLATRTAGWARREASRGVRLRVALPDDPWTRAVRALDPREAVRAVDAPAAGLLEDRLAGRRTPGTVALDLGAASLLGALLALPRRAPGVGVGALLLAAAGLGVAGHRWIALAAVAAAVGLAVSAAALRAAGRPGAAGRGAPAGTSAPPAGS